MAIDVAALKAWEFPILRQRWTDKDSILYALALGYGSDPEDPAQLAFVYEKALQAVPTMATTLCHPGFWISDPRTGIDATRAVHVEHHVKFHRPLPPQGSARAQTRVVDVLDRGDGRGAMLVFERTLVDEASGETIASIEHHTLCRADGGFSGALAERPARTPAPAAPDRPPDHVVEIASLPQAALIYRLSADSNPLHADPEVARAAGFARPLLHGLCTYGIACRAVVQACAANDAARLRSLAVRFSAPVYPGETLRTELWNDGVDALGTQALRLRCLVIERNALVITNGHATLGDPA
jgi:acyl dehydratase